MKAGFVDICGVVHGVKQQRSLACALTYARPRAQASTSTIQLVRLPQLVTAVVVLVALVVTPTSRGRFRVEGMGKFILRWLAYWGDNSYGKQWSLAGLDRLKPSSVVVVAEDGDSGEASL